VNFPAVYEHVFVVVVGGGGGGGFEYIVETISKTISYKKFLQKTKIHNFFFFFFFTISHSFPMGVIFFPMGVILQTYLLELSTCI